MSDPKKCFLQMRPKIVSIATWKDTHFKLTMYPWKDLYSYTIFNRETLL